METYNPNSITYTVRTAVDVLSLDEATQIAKRWVAECGGEAVVYKRWIRPWNHLQKVAVHRRPTS